MIRLTTKFNFLSRLILIGAVLMSVGLSIYAQPSFGGSPLSVGSSQDLRAIGTEVNMVALNFNPNDVELCDAWVASRDGRPLDVGRVVSYKADFAKEATWVQTQGDLRIYRMVVELEGNPVGMGLYYEDFYIPEGGRLFIYTPGGKQVLGAYTHQTHPEHGEFATEPLSGNRLILDYEAPQGVDMPSVLVSEVGYFFRPVFQIAYGQDGLENYQGNEDNSDPGMSQFCQINANCPEGDAYQDQKAGSVAMLMKRGGNLYMCSGNLLNNVRQDYTPYIISAAHCASNEEGAFNVPNYDLDQWIFGFHFEKPRCSSGDYATMTLQSMVGARMKSFLPIAGYSDGLLLLLNDKIPEDYRVYYSGWNAAPTAWQKGAGLHHPAGDATKISLFEGGVVIGQWNGQLLGGSKDHLNFDFVQGNTESGSSGSPLFNTSGEQIGTLSGGRPGICPMDASYGRFFSHFAKYESKGERFSMKHWLDPDNTGVTKVAGRWNGNWQPLRVVKELQGSVVPNDPTKITLSWDAVPAHVQGYAISYKLYRNGELLKTLTGTTYEDTIDEALTKPGQINYMVEAVYTIDGQEVATPAAHRSVYTGELVSRVTPSVSTSGSGTKLEWSMPYNTQVVSKVNHDKLTLLKASHGVEYGFGGGVKIKNIYMYDVYRLGRSPFAGQKLYIHQINFIPTEDTPLLSSGSPDYSKALRFFVRQKKYGRSPMQMTSLIVPQGTAVNKKWMSVKLNNPIEIDDAYDLEVGFSCSGDNKKASVYIDPRAADEYVNSDGCRLAFELQDRQLVTFYPYGHYGPDPDRMGYQAIELVISNNPNKQDGVNSSTFTRGSLPIAFPEIKHYVIYRDGAKVHEVDANTYTWSDASGKQGSEYYVEVVYDYPNELRPIDQVTHVAPQLYPAHFAETLYWAQETDMQRIQLFNAQGVCVVDCSGAELSAGMLDVSSLPEGIYVAIVTTMEGRTTQKLVK